MATLVLSCDHAVCTVPEWHRDRFREAEEALTGHRGWDPGALNLAQAIAMKTRTPLAHGEVTRLLIDLTHGPDDPQRFSGFTRGLSEDQLAKLDERYLAPYLDLLRERIRSGLRIGPPVVHLSVHTFPRENNGARIGTDVGILFDPRRTAEAAFASRWLTALRTTAAELKADANSPRDGTADGLAGLLRREFPDPDYLHVGLEVCQSFFLEGAPWRWDRLKQVVLDCFLHE